MSGKSLVNANAFQGVVDHFEHLGLQMPDELLMDFQKYAEESGDNIYLPMNTFVEALKYGERKTRDPLFALKCGSFVSTKHWGFLGYLLQACENTNQNIGLIKKYSRLLMTNVSVDVIETDTDMVVEVQHCSGEFDNQIRYALEFWIASTLSFVCHWADIENTQVMLSFPWHSKSSDLNQYTDLLQSNCQFDQNKLALATVKTESGFALKSRDPSFYELMLEQTDKLYETSIMQDSWLKYLEEVILKMLPSGTPSVKVISHTLGLSESTLRRRLSERGITYQHFLDSIRKDLSITLIREYDLPLMEVTAQVGFTEQSAFQRAFKRWTGTTPSSFKRDFRKKVAVSM